MRPWPEPSFDLAELAGWRVNDARRRCEADGFTVEVLDLDRSPAVTLDLRPNRIRLRTRRGRVVEAHQG